MRRRTKRLPKSKGLLYVVLLLLLAGCRYIYNNYASTDGEPQQSLTLGIASPSQDEQQSESKQQKSKRQKSKSVNRSGWAELPAERGDKDLYYAYHTVAEENSNDTRRNYAVCFSREHCCPVWVAAALHSSYKGDTKRNDSYQPDPQLPLNIQPSLSRSYGRGYTRGHMLGSAERTSSRACNDQTFYVSNIAPQLRDGFNARAGAWNNLEWFVDRQMCRDTLYVVTGCIFTEYDDTDGTTIAPTKISSRDGKRVSVPTAYYKAMLRTRSGNSGKSVKECKERELKCAALIVGHHSANGRKPSAEELITIKELERLTGEKFFVNIPNAPKDEANARDWGIK